MATPAPSSYPSPPSSRAASPSRAAEQDQNKGGLLGPDSSSAEAGPDEDLTLSARLDALLESYLELLDTYTTLRAQLSADFSSGFLALAQANRTSNLGPSRRYGEEGYDERMKASKLLQITCKQNEPQRMPQKSQTIEPTDQYQARQNVHPEHKHEDSIGSMHKDPDNDQHNSQNRVSHNPQDQTNPASSLTQLPSHHPTAQSFTYTMISGPTVTEDTSEKDTSSSKSKSLDPLKWYGILIPPHLRQCQALFTTSVNSTVPELLSTVSSLATLEQDILLLRREMGILKDDTNVDVQQVATS